MFFKTHIKEDIFDKKFKLLFNKFNKYWYCDIYEYLEKRSPIEIYESNIIYPLRLIDKLKKNPIIINIDTTAYEYRYNSYSHSKKIFKELLFINQYKSNKFKNWTYLWILSLWEYNILFDKKMLENENIDLSSGKQIRNFIYIDDAIMAIIKCIENIIQFSHNSTIKYSFQW